MNAIHGRRHPRSRPLLQYELDRLNHKDVRQRRMAVRRLFEIDDPAALAAFIELLDDDDEWFVERPLMQFVSG